MLWLLAVESSLPTFSYTEIVVAAREGFTLALFRSCLLQLHVHLQLDEHQVIGNNTFQLRQNQVGAGQDLVLPKQFFFFIVQDTPQRRELEVHLW